MGHLSTLPALLGESLCVVLKSNSKNYNRNNDNNSGDDSRNDSNGR